MRDFEDVQYAKDFLCDMGKLWEEEFCTDFTVFSCDGKSVKVHKVALAAASPYFK